MATAGPASAYRPWRPERTVLYRVLSQHFERFVQICDERFAPQPRAAATRRAGGGQPLPGLRHLRLRRSPRPMRGLRARCLHCFFLQATLRRPPFRSDHVGQVMFPGQSESKRHEVRR